MIDLAADRTPYVCQAQSLNIFLPANVHKKELHALHWLAWKKGVKSLYYCRSMSLARAEAVAEAAPTAVKESRAGAQTVAVVAQPTKQTEYEECLACQ
jgi:ribonucleoside-diphosphate reductase alpha chain